MARPPLNKANLKKKTAEKQQPVKPEKQNDVETESQNDSNQWDKSKVTYYLDPELLFDLEDYRAKLRRIHRRAVRNSDIISAALKAAFEEFDQLGESSQLAARTKEKE